MAEVENIINKKMLTDFWSTRYEQFLNGSIFLNYNKNGTDIIYHQNTNNKQLYEKRRKTK